jgi:hypothetical protein
LISRGGGANSTYVVHRRDHGDHRARSHQPLSADTLRSVARCLRGIAHGHPNAFPLMLKATPMRFADAANTHDAAVISPVGPGQPGIDSSCDGGVVPASLT